MAWPTTESLPLQQVAILEPQQLITDRLDQLAWRRAQAKAERVPEVRRRAKIGTIIARTREVRTGDFARRPVAGSDDEEQRREHQRHWRPQRESSPVRVRGGRCRTTTRARTRSTPRRCRSDRRAPVARARTRRSLLAAAQTRLDRWCWRARHPAAIPTDRHRDHPWYRQTTTHLLAAADNGAKPRMLARCANRRGWLDAPPTRRRRRTSWRQSLDRASSVRTRRNRCASPRSDRERTIRLAPTRVRTGPNHAGSRRVRDASATPANDRRCMTTARQHQASGRVLRPGAARDEPVRAAPTSRRRAAALPEE